jgi:DNA-binding response OmpR family regulator
MSAPLVTTNSRARVLVVEDAKELRAIISRSLVADGFDVDMAVDGPAAVTTMRAAPADIVVLDIGLPGMSGVEVCRQIRTFSDAYIVMLTAQTDETDKIVGLSVGADDYMTKPFSPRELSARLNAMLRRPRAGQAPVPSAADAPGDLVVDEDAREVLVRGTTLELTRIEFDLLATLARRPRKVLSRRRLVDEVWGAEWFGEDHVVEVHVSNLRRKLDALTSHRYIATVRGVGYRFEPTSEVLTH